MEFSWVDDGDRGGVEPSTGEQFVAHSAQHGEYPIQIEKSEPPRYLAYRWASAFAGQQPIEGNSTLVEFTLTEEETGATRLRVVETGFASLPEDSRRQAYDDNVGGWKEQLGVLKGSVEA